MPKGLKDVSACSFGAYLLRSPSVRLCVPLRSCPEGATRSERDAPSGPLWGPLCSLPRRGPFGHILLLPRRGNDVIYADTFPAPKGAVCARPFGPLRGNILTKKTRYSILEDPPAPKGAVCASLGFAKEQLAKPIDNTTCLPRRGTRNNWLCQ